MKASKYIPCPCDSKHLYSRCCKRFHDGALPESPEQLMRSRYSAYALRMPHYLMDTTHPDNSSWTSDRQAWERDILAFCDATMFHGLAVTATAEEADCAYVTFTATLMQNSRDASFTERSKFVKNDGRWMYRSGTFE